MWCLPFWYLLSTNSHLRMPFLWLNSLVLILGGLKILGFTSSVHRSVTSTLGYTWRPYCVAESFLLWHTQHPFWGTSSAPSPVSVVSSESATFCFVIIICRWRLVYTYSHLSFGVQRVVPTYYSWLLVLLFLLVRLFLVPLLTLTPLRLVLSRSVSFCLVPSRSVSSSVTYSTNKPPSDGPAGSSRGTPCVGYIVCTHPSALTGWLSSFLM